MRSRATAAATAAALACLLAGCGSSAGGDPGTVVYWDTSGAGESAVFTEIAQECGRTGGYAVDVQTVAFDQALNNFKTAAQGGQGPDVLRADVGWVAQLAQAGLIQDLSGTPLADTADFLPEPVESTRYDGKPYAVPQVTDTLALLYNERALAEAGVEPPRTWADLERIAPALGGDRAMFLNNDAFYALPFLYAEGGDLVDTGTKTITVDSPESVRGLGIAKDLIDSGAARTALDQTNSYSIMKAAFTSGEVAMVLDGPWVIPELSQSELFADGQNLGIAPVPGPGGPIGGHDYVLRQGSDATENATEFVECMSSTANQAAIAERLGLLPTRRSAYDEPAVADHPVVSAFRPLVENTLPRAWIPEGNELLEPLKTAYAQVLAGHADAGTALDRTAGIYHETVLDGYTRR